MRPVNLRRAFTITELVVVIAIILMIVGLSSYALMSARKATEGMLTQAQAAVQNELGDGTADDRRLLHAVTRESIHEQKILQQRMGTQDGVVVEGVHFKIAGPRALESGCLEGGNPMRERGPQPALEGVVVRLQRLIVRIVGGR